jgi:hypothetical protein
VAAREQYNQEQEKLKQAAEIKKAEEAQKAAWDALPQESKDTINNIFGKLKNNKLSTLTPQQKFKFATEVGQSVSSATDTSQLIDKIDSIISKTMSLSDADKREINRELIKAYLKVPDGKDLKFDTQSHIPLQTRIHDVIAQMDKQTGVGLHVLPGAAYHNEKQKLKDAIGEALSAGNYDEFNKAITDLYFSTSLTDKQIETLRNLIASELNTPGSSHIEEPPSPPTPEQKPALYKSPEELEQWWQDAAKNFPFNWDSLGAAAQNTIYDAWNAYTHNDSAGAANYLKYGFPNSPTMQDMVFDVFKNAVKGTTPIKPVNTPKVDVNALKSQIATQYDIGGSTVDIVIDNLLDGTWTPEQAISYIDGHTMLPLKTIQQMVGSSIVPAIMQKSSPAKQKTPDEVASEYEKELKSNPFLWGKTPQGKAKKPPKPKPLIMNLINRNLKNATPQIRVAAMYALTTIAQKGKNYDAADYHKFKEAMNTAGANERLTRRLARWAVRQATRGIKFDSGGNTDPIATVNAAIAKKVAEKKAEVEWQQKQKANNLSPSPINKPSSNQQAASSKKIAEIPPSKDPHGFIKKTLVPGEKVVVSAIHSWSLPGDNTWTSHKQLGEWALAQDAERKKTLSKADYDIFTKAADRWQGGSQWNQAPQSRKFMNEIFSKVANGPPPSLTTISQPLERGMTLRTEEVEDFLEAFRIGEKVYLGPSGFSEDRNTARKYASEDDKGIGVLMRMMPSNSGKIKGIRIHNRPGHESFNGEKEVVVGASKNATVLQVIKHVQTGYDYKVKYEIIMQQKDEDLNEGLLYRVDGLDGSYWKGLSRNTVKTLIKYLNNSVHTTW